MATEIRKEFVMRAGKIVHPKKGNSGYCVNAYNTLDGKDMVIFASEITKDSKSDKYYKNYFTDFVVMDAGLYLYKLPNGKGYMVGVNTPTCVTLMLCDAEGKGKKACMSYANNGWDAMSMEFEHDGNDVVVMKKFSEVIGSIDPVVSKNLKITIANELIADITEAMKIETPAIGNKRMFSNKVEIINDVLEQIA